MRPGQPSIARVQCSPPPTVGDYDEGVADTDTSYPQLRNLYPVEWLKHTIDLNSSSLFLLGKGREVLVRKLK
jgi:hypothetical protein